MEKLVGTIVQYVRVGGPPGEETREVVQAAIFVESSELGLKLLNLATGRLLEDVPFSATPKHNTWRFVPGTEDPTFDAAVYGKTIRDRRDARLEAKKQQKKGNVSDV